MFCLCSRIFFWRDVMDKAEIYYRVKRMIIIILIAMTLISFVAVINLSFKIEDLNGAVDVLIEYIRR